MHLAFMDMDAIYFSLQRLKSEKAWYNLNLSRADIAGLLADPSWYRLYIPREQMEPSSFSQVRQWQEIAVSLLRKYCDRFYNLCKAGWENEHLEYGILAEEDSNFIEDYRVLIDQSRNDIVTALGELKAIIESGRLRPWEFQGITSIMFDRHLYQPLLHVRNELVEVRPIPLNEGERDFVMDLKQFCDGSPAFLKNRELYLLRNMSRGRGIGFFEAGNFYPDFIVWLLAGDQQYITFVDPKGLRNLQGPDDPKIAFYRKIKDVEEDLRQQDPSITLNSFIISNTRVPEVSWWSGGMTKADFEQCHVLFQEEDKAIYIGKMLEMATA
jgi:hypothetical protein